MVTADNIYKRTGWIVEVGAEKQFTSRKGQTYGKYPIVYQESSGKEFTVEAIDFVYKNFTASQLNGSQMVEITIELNGNENYPDSIKEVVSVADNGFDRPAPPAASPADTIVAFDSAKDFIANKPSENPFLLPALLQGSGKASRPARADEGPKPDNNSRWLQFNTSLRTAHMQATERVGHLVQLLLAGKLVIKQGDKVEPVTAITKEILEGWYADLVNHYWGEDEIISREDVFGALHPPQEGVGNAEYNPNG